MRRATVFLFAALLPAFALGGPTVPREQIIASPQGAWYVIVQPGGEFDVVQRSADAPPMRSREGKAPITDQQLRLGATAEEVMRSAGMLPGLRPDPGDAVLGGGQLRADPLDLMHVFDDGSGLIARYSKGPTQFDGISPIREPDGADIALVAVDTTTTGPNRTTTNYVHLYTLKDATFWGDAERQLVVMVAGGANVVLTADKGAVLLNRTQGKRPRMVAWSLATREVVSAPMESLYTQIMSLQAQAGITALLLAREMEPEAVLEPLKAVVKDLRLPHVTRLHAAATLRASGLTHGNRTILSTAHGLDRSRPEEQPIPLADGVPADADPSRDFAIRVLPVSHGDQAIDDLLGMALGEDERIAALAEAALEQGPWPADSRWLETMALLARDRGRPTATRALATRMLVSRSDDRVGELLTWLAAEPEPEISEPVLDVYGDRIGDEPLIARITAGLAAEDLAYESLLAGVGALGDRAWRSEDARSALLGLVPDPTAPTADDDDDDSALPEVPDRVLVALGALWRVDDPRVPPLLDAWAQHPVSEAASAADHSRSIRAWRDRRSALRAEAIHD
jgi:hypothetical protein